MKKYFFLVLLFLLCRGSFAVAETYSGPLPVTHASDTTIDKNTLRKLLHWVSVFTLYSDVDLTDKVDLKEYAEAADLASSFITNPELSILIAEFKASTFVNVYPKGLIHSEEWLYKKLNQVAEAQYSTLNAPYVSLEVWFTPVDQNSGYLVTLNFKSSAEIKESISAANVKANQALSGNKFSEPRQSKEQVNKAIAVGLEELKTLLSSTYAPNIALLYNEEMYLNKNTIEAWQASGKTLELKAVDKNGNLLTESVIWANATGTGSIASYPLDAVGTNSVTLKAGNNQISVNVKVKEFTLDVNELLKRLIVEALTAKKKKATDDLVLLRQDSVTNTTNLSDAIARLEKANFPLESTEATLTPLFSEPILTDSATALTTSEKVESFNHLRKRKRLLNTIKQNLNVSAFADLVVNNPDRLNELVDELLRNSGELIANLIIGKDSKGQEDVARDIVVDYINQTLEGLTSDYTDYSIEEVLPIAPPAVTSSTPTFKADQYVYINPQVSFSDKDAFVKQLQDSLKGMQPPLYVFINYSQDVSTETYLQRSQHGRPVGLPADARYRVFTVVNIPGSVKEQLFVGNESAPQANAQSNTKDKILEVIRGFKADKESALMATFLDNGWEECYKGLKLVTAAANFEDRKELPIAKHNNDCFGGALFQLVTGELLWRTPDRLGNPTYYVLYPAERQWQPFKLPPLDCTSCDIAWLVSQVQTAAVRYLTPIEDIVVVLEGKDLDGVESSKLLAGVFLVVDIVPGGKIFRPVKKLGQAGLKGTKKLLVTVGKTSKVYIGEVVDGLYKPFKWIKPDRVDEVLEVTDEVTYLAEDGVQRVGKLEVVRSGSEYGVRVFKEVVTILKNFTKPISFGGDIMKTVNKKINILGRVNPKDGSIGTKKLYDELIEASVSKDEVTGLFTQMPNEWSKLSVVDMNTKYWNEINKLHIDNIIENGGDIRFIHDPRLTENEWNLVSDMLDGPFKQKCISEGITKLKSFMKMEYDYLRSKGYQLLENGLMVNP